MSGHFHHSRVWWAVDGQWLGCIEGKIFQVNDKIKRQKSAVEFHAGIMLLIQHKSQTTKVLYFLIGCLVTYGLTQLSTISIHHCSLDNLKNTPTDQFSPCLTQIVREVLVPPSKHPYNLQDGNREHSHGQAQLIKMLFQEMVRKNTLDIWMTDSPFWHFQRNGFFVEAGALDGERGSNSLSLEKDLGWSGLLAEGDPSNVEIVK